jgi:catechol 2,3-dioxygenase-like lactoylglutathione lyase family enzyme
MDLGLTHVALPVTDLDRSIDFYAVYAGAEVIHRRTSEDSGRGVAWVSDRTRPFVIVLIEMESVPHPLRSPAHLGVALADRAEVDRLSDRAREEGRLLSEPVDAGPPVGYWSLVSDPDGHTLELTFGQHVGRTVEDDA